MLAAAGYAGNRQILGLKKRDLQWFFSDECIVVDIELVKFCGTPSFQNTVGVFWLVCLLIFHG